MALVGYSDSEGSEDEQQSKAPNVKEAPTPIAKQGFNSIVDRSNPGKIRVNLAEKLESNGVRQDGEPAPKRARTGGGAFSGFNSILPPPKRTAPATGGSTASSNKAAPRKVFSLKTGAEPGFDRSADAELKQMFAEQETERQGNSIDGQNGQRPEKQISTPATTDESLKPKSGNPMMFKPLSVARNPQKKKKPQPPPASPHETGVPEPSDNVPPPSTSAAVAQAPRPAQPKMSLFSIRSEETQAVQAPAPSQSEYEPLVYSSTTSDPDAQEPILSTTATIDQPPTGPQTLQSIASDLRLSASDQRQLFGRQKPSSSTPNIINFNTDAEYASNEALRASGEADAAAQARTVKAIAPGKHSLKQLISSASGQIEALEDSFAAGRRKKGEAGSRYGW